MAERMKQKNCIKCEAKGYVLVFIFAVLAFKTKRPNQGAKKKKMSVWD